MVRLKLWQWFLLIIPIASIVGFVLFAAGSQIHTWGLSWIWGLFTLIIVAWQSLLARWTKPTVQQIEKALTEVQEQLETPEIPLSLTGQDYSEQVQLTLENILKESQNDPPIWENGAIFWQRCRSLTTAIAHIYHPEVKYPLLNIYIPQAYTLIRGTVDDLDRWMQNLSPVLSQVTVGQAYQAYEVYQKLEPSARKLWQVWNWTQWIFNPVAATAKLSTQKTSEQATQQLLINLSQLLREAALKNLCYRAVMLYGGTSLPFLTVTPSPATLPQGKTRTLRDIITQGEPVETVAEKPVNILIIGRTGAGKSSLINTLFNSDRAQVDVLPNTGSIQSYSWQIPGDSLILWDTPGYEQINRQELRKLVLDYAHQGDLLLLVTPALDPALQMDLDFLEDMRQEVPTLPILTVVTQVDRLRPLREWQPPYDWQNGDRPKEKAIREATQYRTEVLGQWCQLVLPLVTQDSKIGRESWNINLLSRALIEAITPAKQLRLARFLEDQETRILACAKIIDRYTFQMATTQGLTAFLKSPVLKFISILTTGSPTLAYVLAEQIPVEQLPVVIGKLQMAYDLFSVLSPFEANLFKFDFQSIWSLVLERHSLPDRDAWAFGHALVEYWTQKLTVEQLQKRYQYYLKRE